MGHRDAQGIVTDQSILRKVYETFKMNKVRGNLKENRAKNSN